MGLIRVPTVVIHAANDRAWARGREPEPGVKRGGLEVHQLELLVAKPVQGVRGRVSK